jgi:polyhydroxyalkanoate synthesis regulator phasin
MADDTKKTDSPDIAGLMENAFLMGIGVMEITRDKVAGLTEELVARGKMSDSEAKKVAERMGTMAGEQQEAIRKTVVTETDKVMKTSGMATKSDVDSLRAEIAELKAMLAKEHAGAGDAPDAD